MAVIALVSGKGSPGVTTCALALGLAWPGRAPEGRAEPPDRPVLVVDADPAGCGVAVGYLRGAVGQDAGLVGLLAQRDDLENAVWANTVALDRDGTRLLLPGLRDPEQFAAMTTTGPGWAGLAEALASASAHGSDVLIDLGRLGPGSPQPLLACADLLVVVARSSLSSVCGARHAIHQLRQLRRPQGSGPAVGVAAAAVLLAGQPGPYSAREICGALGAPVLARIDWDPASARVLSDGEPAGWRFGRSALIRSARVAASSITTMIGSRAAKPAPGVPAGLPSNPAAAVDSPRSTGYGV